MEILRQFNFVCLSGSTSLLSLSLLLAESSDALVSSTTTGDEDADGRGRCNPAVGNLQLFGEEEIAEYQKHRINSPAAVARNFEENLLLPQSEPAAWYPKLLTRPRSSCDYNPGRGADRNRIDSFPAGLEISAMSVVSLYDLDDETRTMDR